MTQERFSLEVADNVAVFKFADTPLYFSTDLLARDRLFGAFGDCARDEAVRVIVLFDFPEKAGSSEYTDFLRRVVREGDTRGLQRMLNVFNQLILTIVECDKFVIFADRGVAISQYFNVSLACDYRVVASDLRVQKAYLRHGLVPKGGGALFVSDRVGRAKAYEVLLDDEDLTASQALELGLVDEVVEPAELERATLDAARRFAAKPGGTLSGLKRLMAFRWRNLDDYLELESQEIVRLLRTADLT